TDRNRKTHDGSPSVRHPRDVGADYDPRRRSGAGLLRPHLAPTPANHVLAGKQIAGRLLVRNLALVLHAVGTLLRRLVRRVLRRIHLRGVSRVAERLRDW